MTKIDLKDIQQKLYERLKPSGWGDKLKGFILSDDFYNILDTLSQESQSGKHFTPVIKNLFRAFEECPYNELKVIMVVGDPYTKANVADGIALSCSNVNHVVPKSLLYFLREIEQTVYPEEGYYYDPDLTRLANQGVLLLNAALTTTIGNTQQHAELWKPFTTYLFDTLNTNNTGLVYVFIGINVRHWKTHVSSKNNFKFFINHPSMSILTHRTHWDSGDLFNQINKILMNHYKTKIIW